MLFWQIMCHGHWVWPTIFDVFFALTPTTARVRLFDVAFRNAYSFFSKWLLFIILPNCEHDQHIFTELLWPWQMSSCRFYAISHVISNDDFQFGNCNFDKLKVVYEKWRQPSSKIHWTKSNKRNKIRFFFRHRLFFHGYFSVVQWIIVSVGRPWITT